LEQIEKMIDKLMPDNDSKPFPDTGGASFPDASLEQNFPNPFNQTTTINYTLPQTFRTAQIVITTTSSRILRQIPITGSGAGSVTVEAGAWPAGIYYYSLLVNERLIDTKKMILM
jgi:hypothetical protein